ncbi:hypothetical protein QBC36DRAFT_294270 [Triangularia setosa]|uniref:Uncharacterized protein n=1 Tax=Triangularia setosa TaxID=2587417 RepID=A0AAN7A3B6_9PEZI|nr:hypothetical protein QBC36DRAFT_294270 [Podospora setosa]
MSVSVSSAENGQVVGDGETGRKKSNRGWEELGEGNHESSVKVAASGGNWWDSRFVNGANIDLWRISYGLSPDSTFYKS